MKANVVTDFTDKHTQKRSYKGDVIELSKERFDELAAKNIVSNMPIEAEKEKIEVKQEPEKVEIISTTKKEKKEGNPPKSK